MDDFGAAVVFFIIMGVVGTMGFLIGESVNASACKDYGKTRMFTQVYECKLVEKK